MPAQEMLGQVNEVIGAVRGSAICEQHVPYAMHHMGVACESHFTGIMGGPRGRSSMLPLMSE